MPRKNPGHRLDVRSFALAARELEGSDRLLAFPRVMQACDQSDPQETVRWRARGETRSTGLEPQQTWLHLDARASVGMTCQRCLERVQLPLAVDRWFRFVDDEATATAQDETCEEEVLVLAGDFNLHELIEDELLLALPYIARHDACPSEPALTAADPDFVDAPARPNPFASLGAFKAPKAGDPT